MKIHQWAVVFLLLFLCQGLFLGQPPAAPAKTVVIHAGRLLDVKSGKTLSGQTIVIRGDKVTSVGTDSQVQAGATVIDLPNATILPGLIDAHTHITFNPKFG